MEGCVKYFWFLGLFLASSYASLLHAMFVCALTFWIVMFYLDE